MPLPSEPVEYLGAQLEHLHAKGAPSEHLGTAVAEHQLALVYIAGLFQASRRLRCRLLAHPEPTTELTDRDAVGADRLQGEAMDRSRLVVAAPAGSACRSSMIDLKAPSRSSGSS